MIEIREIHSPDREIGDLTIFRESPGESGRLNMYALYKAIVRPHLEYCCFSRDVTRSRVCLVTPLIRHFGGQASAAVCAVCALQCGVYTSDQPACGMVCLWML